MKQRRWCDGWEPDFVLHIFLKWTLYWHLAHIPESIQIISVQHKGFSPSELPWGEHSRAPEPHSDLSWLLPHSVPGASMWASTATYWCCLFSFKRSIYLFNMVALALCCCTKAFQLLWVRSALCGGARAPHCGSFSGCGARALELGLSSCGIWA